MRVHGGADGQVFMEVAASQGGSGAGVGNFTWYPGVPPEELLDGAYETANTYFGPTMPGGDDVETFDLAKAVLGEDVVARIVAQGAQDKQVLDYLVTVELIIMEAIQGEAHGFIRPEIGFASLDTGVNGYFKPGEPGRPGQIVLSHDLKTRDPEFVDRVVLEELGEALAEYLGTDRGIPLGEGDVGHRLMKVFLGEPLVEEDFDPKHSDKVLVRSNQYNASTEETTTTVEIWDSLGVTEAEYNTALADAEAFVAQHDYDDSGYLSKVSFDEDELAEGNVETWERIVDIYGRVAGHGGNNGLMPYLEAKHLAIALLDGSVTITSSGHASINFDEIRNESLVTGIFQYIEDRDNGSDRLDQLTIEQIDAAVNDIMNDFHAIQADRDFEGLTALLSDGEGGTISRSALLGAFKGGVLTRNTSIDKGDHVSITVNLDETPAEAIYRYGPEIQATDLTLTSASQAGDVIGSLSVLDEYDIDPSQISLVKPDPENADLNVVDGQLVLNTDITTDEFVVNNGLVSEVFQVRDADGNVQKTVITVNVEQAVSDDEDEEEYTPIDEWTPDPDVDNSGWIASDGDDVYISDDPPADTEMYAQDDLAAWFVLVDAVNEVSRDDDLLTQSDLWDVLQHVGGESQVTNHYARNLINIYGNGTHVKKVAVLEHMTIDGFLAPDPEVQNGWKLQWENIDGVDMARGIMNMAGITDYSGTITGKQFDIAFDTMFNPASFTDPDVGVPAATNFEELKDFIYNELQQTFATQSDSTADLLGGVFTLHDIADIFDSATLKVSASADTNDYVITVDDTAVKAKDEEPVAGFATSDANSDGIIDMSEFVAHTGLPEGEATRMAALYGYNKSATDGTTESFFSKYQLSVMIDEGALVAPAAGATAWTTDLNQVNNARLVDAIFKHFGKTAGNDNLTAEQLAEGIEAATGVALADPAHADYLVNVFGRSSPVDEAKQIVNGDDVLDMFTDGDHATATLLRDFANVSGDTTINYEDLTDMSGKDYLNAQWWDTVVGAGAKFGEGIGHYVTALFNAVAEINKPFGESDVAALLNGRDLQEPSVQTAWDVILDEVEAGNADVHAAIDDLFNLHVAYLADEQGGGLSAAEMAWFLQLGDKASTGDAMAVEALFKFTAMSRETLRKTVLRVYEQGLFTDGVANLTFGEVKEAIPDFDEAYALAEEYKEFQIDSFIEDGFVWDTVLASVGGDFADAQSRLLQEGLAVGEGGAIVTSAGDAADETVERNFYDKHMRFEFVLADEVDLDFLPAFNGHEFHQFKPYVTFSMPRENETGLHEMGLKFGTKNTVGAIGVSNNIALKTGPGTSNDTIISFLNAADGQPTANTKATNVTFRNSLTFMGLAHTKAENANWENLSGATSDFFKLLASYKPAWLPGDTTIPPSFLPPGPPAAPPGMTSAWPVINYQMGAGYGLSHTYDLEALGEDAWMPMALSAAGSVVGGAMGYGLADATTVSPTLGTHLGGQVASVLSHIAYSQYLAESAENANTDSPVKRTHGAYGWGLVQASTAKGQAPLTESGTSMGKFSFQGTMFQSPSVADIG